MKEYRFSIAVNGRFLFRTDWMVDNAPFVSRALTTKFPANEGYTVTLDTRDSSYQSDTLVN